MHEERVGPCAGRDRDPKAYDVEGQDNRDTVNECVKVWHGSVCM